MRNYDSEVWTPWFKPSELNILGAYQRLRLSPVPGSCSTYHLHVVDKKAYHGRTSVSAHLQEIGFRRTERQILTDVSCSQGLPQSGEGIDKKKAHFKEIDHVAMCHV